MGRKIGVIVLALLCALLYACGQEKPTREKLPVTGELTVAVLDVGKADAIVVTTAEKTMVIDTGETDDGGKILNYLNTLDRSVIDWLVITHYDRDHVGGADRLLNFADVRQVIRPDYAGEREEYENFVSALSQLATPDTAIAAGSADMTFMMDDVQVSVNAPAKTAYTNSGGAQQDNNFSLIVRLRHGSRALLFGGDAEDERLAELITGGADWSADFLKVPYHGNYTQLSASFFQKVLPSVAVICDSAKNPAADQTVSALAATGAKVYATRNGTVICKSDGDKLTVTQ